jgi:LysM repeat protein
MSRVSCFSKWWLVAGLAALFVHAPALADKARAKDEERASYTVKPGDVLGLIAQRQGVSLALLRKVNGVTSDTIRPGQSLLLPAVHEVKPGESLGTIAERFGVTVNELYRHNDLSEESVLKVGQQVIVVGGTRAQPLITEAGERRAANGNSPAKSTPSTQPAEKHEPKPPDVDYYRHEVRPNEVLSVIAARYSVSTKELCELNQLRNASLIRVGQSLNIPVSDKNAHLTRPKS